MCMKRRIHVCNCQVLLSGAYVCVCVCLCDMTHSMCDVTHSCVWHDLFICVTAKFFCQMPMSVWMFVPVKWRISRVTWLIHVCGITHSRVSLSSSFARFVCLCICPCDMTHFMCVAWHEDERCTGFTISENELWLRTMYFATKLMIHTNTSDAEAVEIGSPLIFHL